MTIRFEALNERHRRAVIDILNYYVENSTAAYRSEPVDYGFYDNFLEEAKEYPGYAVIDQDDSIIGFCTLEAFMPIKTFSAVAEATYFIHNAYTGKGIGKKALDRLEEDAERMGISKIVVNISDDNDRSIDFHKGNGFIEYGRLGSVGHKLCKRFGIVYMEKTLGRENM